jgi:hypothetical protein
MGTRQQSLRGGARLGRSARGRGEPWPAAGLGRLGCLQGGPCRGRGREPRPAVAGASLGRFGWSAGDRGRRRSNATVRRLRPHAYGGSRHVCGCTCSSARARAGSGRRAGTAGGPGCCGDVWVRGGTERAPADQGGGGGGTRGPAGRDATGVLWGTFIPQQLSIAVYNTVYNRLSSELRFQLQQPSPHNPLDRPLTTLQQRNRSSRRRRSARRAPPPGPRNAQRRRAGSTVCLRTCRLSRRRRAGRHRRGRCAGAWCALCTPCRYR